MHACKIYQYENKNNNHMHVWEGVKFKIKQLYVLLIEVEIFGCHIDLYMLRVSN